MTELGMAHRIQFFLLTTLVLAGQAQAGDFPVGVPIPLTGLSGPVGLATAAAAYLAYRTYKRYSRNG